MPDRASDFGNFATAIARRYPERAPVDDLGRAQPQAQLRARSPPTKKVDGKLNRAQRVAPHNYAQLLDAAYEALKAESPAQPRDRRQHLHRRGPADSTPTQWIRHMRLPDGSRRGWTCTGTTRGGRASRTSAIPLPARRGRVR